MSQLGEAGKQHGHDVAMTKYLFIICPPYSGSTVLHDLLETSERIATLPDEGQHLPEVKKYYGPRRWYREPAIDWQDVKTQWHGYWDTRKPVLLEKSPPNLLHAPALEQHFQPSYFIVLMRNPYANCSGFRRRMGLTVRRSAKFWQHCARNQLHNLNTLENVLFVTYEHMVRTPAKMKKDILRFLPEIEDFDVELRLDVHSIEGNRVKRLTDYNQKNIHTFSVQDIAEINSVFQEEPSLLANFGYQFYDPGLRHRVGYWSRKFSRRLIRIRERLALST